MLRKGKKLLPSAILRATLQYTKHCRFFVVLFYVKYLTYFFATCRFSSLHKNECRVCRFFNTFYFCKNCQATCRQNGKTTKTTHKKHSLVFYQAGIFLPEFRTLLNSSWFLTETMEGFEDATVSFRDNFHPLAGKLAYGLNSTIPSPETGY